MKLLSAIVLMAVVFGGTAFAEITKLDSKQRKIIQSSTFRQLKSVKELPSGVAALCADNNGRLAEPSQKWQVTDVIFDESLPRKRLVWAAASQNYYIVHYESGGRGHSFHTSLIAANKPSTILWHGVGPKLNDFNEFRKALEENNLDDRLDYAK